MSAYANFFIRWKDEFIPIADYSRNSFIFEIVQYYAPYEKIQAVPTRIVEQWIDEAEKQITDCKNRIQQYQERIKLVSTFNNSVDEKMSVLRDYDDAVEELNSYIDDAIIAREFFKLLTYQMIPAVQYNKDLGIDYEHYIYVGIEIGRPTMEDIVNDAT